VHEIAASAAEVTTERTSSTYLGLGLITVAVLVIWLLRRKA
jgi:uncharacterized membrane protein